jgi:acyl-CoA hydrolase
MNSTIDEAIGLIKSGSNLFIQTGAAAPQQLIKGLISRAYELRDITIY